MVKIYDKNKTRIEKKYKIFSVDLVKLLKFIKVDSEFRKVYPSRLVNSLYYDTNNYAFASSNMSGESCRSKVRARWYGNNSLEDLVSSGAQITLEIKRKFNNYGDKISGRLIANPLDSEIYLAEAAEWPSYLDFCDLPTRLHPAVFVNYEREYYALTSDPDIRLTVDSNIKYNSPYSSQASVLSVNYKVVELKFPVDKMQYVVGVMNEFPFRPVRFSKYVASISKLKNISY